MYKLIIVDDEYGSARLMAEFIDYEEFGFSVSEVFSSAEKALEYIKDNSIDLIISDIKMYGMSGLELLKIVNERYPRIKVVLISAYRDFAYAKEAIAYDAFGYITKPISYSEFTNTLIKLKKELQKRDNTAISDINAVTTLQEKMFEYFNGRISASELEAVLKTYDSNIDILHNKCSVININIPDITEFMALRWKYGIEKFYHAIKQIIPIKMNNILLSFLSGDNCTIKIIAVDICSDTDYKKNLENTVSYISYEIFSVFGLNVDISVNTETSISKLDEKGVMSATQFLGHLQFCIINNDRAKINNILDDFFDDKSIKFRHELCTVITNEALKNCPKAQEICVDAVTIKCIDNAELLKEYAGILINCMMNNAESIKTKNYDLLKSLAYISHNYANKLSLDYIASYAGFTTSYMSHYFKKMLNESFSDFIARVRIENAMKILRENPNTKINSLVTTVGYNSQPYFYKVFKKYTGCLPGEYKG